MTEGLFLEHRKALRLTDIVRGPNSASLRYEAGEKLGYQLIFIYHKAE